MGRIERPPGWILKYKEGIEAGTITVEQILSMENELRETPIKISSVTRAINAMGLPITGLRGRTKSQAQATDLIEVEKTDDDLSPVEKTPAWIQQYRDRIEDGTITAEQILEEENERRVVPIKIATVKRVVNAMVHSVGGMKNEEQNEMEEIEETSKQSDTPTAAQKGPGWLQKYRDRIEAGTITVDEILAEENKSRDSPIKRSSVTRAINAMGFTIAGMRRGKREAAKEKEEPVKKAPKAETFVYGSSIGKLSEMTIKRFNDVKKSWEEDLGKNLQNDYFLNVLLALAKLAEHGKTLTPVQS